jgi:hypothetical protein
MPLFTVIISVATVIILVVQSVILWRQANIMRQQTAISKQQAEIADALQAPVISIRIIESGMILEHGSGDHFYRPRELIYCYVNHGNTPAYLTRQGERFDAIPAGSGLPEPIDPNDPHVADISYGAFVPARDESHETKVNLLPHLLSPEQDAFYEPDKFKFFMTFYARFEDVLGESWELGACYILSGSSFVQAGGTKQHNYYRKCLHSAKRSDTSTKP